MMVQFTPYDIVHLSITAIGTVVPEGQALCYLWWRDIPLGHVWLDGVTRYSLQDFRYLVLEQVQPTIRYYLNKGGRDSDQSWESLFLDGADQQLDVLLEDMLSSKQLIEGIDRTEQVSIVICTRNRASMLKTCIAALMDNTDTHFELIIIDNAPDDESTKNIIAQYPGIKYVREPRKGLDIARNTGARNATNDIIAYVDDDVTVDKNWVRKLKNCFTDPMVLAVTGQVIPVELKTRSQYIFERYWGFNKGYVPKVFDYKYFTTHLDNGVPVWNIGAGANMAFRKDAFKIAGWFDKRLDAGAAGCSGDSEMWYRILAERWNCSYCPQLYVYHHHRESKEALSNQVFNYMRGQVTSLYVQHERYGHKGNLRRINNILPLYYLKRIRNRITSGYTEDFGTITDEIKGFIAGLFYYRSARAENFQPAVVAGVENFQPPGDLPLVSVVITCYNYANYLAQAIDSVINQTYKNTEIIVVDDGSTDDTQAVIAKYPDIINVQTQRVGASAARNIGIGYSRGELLLFLDADDYLYPDAIEVNYSFFKKNPECAFVAGAFDKIDDSGNRLPSNEPREHLGNYYIGLLGGNHIGMLGNILYRRSLFFNFHFDTSLRNCEDYDLNLRISKHYPSCSHTTKIIAYRQHPGNKSGNTKKMYATIKKTIQTGLKNWKDYYDKTL